MKRSWLLRTACLLGLALLMLGCGETKKITSALC